MCEGMQSDQVLEYGPGKQKESLVPRCIEWVIE